MKSLLFAFLMLGHLPASQAASSFNDIYSVVFQKGLESKANPDFANELDVYQMGQLPHYEVTLSSFYEKGVDVLARAVNRTLNQDNDYYERITKLLHPNGICFAGLWKITKASKYTGLYAQGTEALMIARASTATSATEKGAKRGFGFAGKIFPTADPRAVVETSNFFTIDVLAGRNADHFTDVSLTNQPDLGFNPSLLALMPTVILDFEKGDSNPLFRPLYPISMAGLSDKKTAVTPKWMMIRPSANTKKYDQADFRDELIQYQRLVFDILVSDESSDRSSKSWKTMGQIDLTQSMVSYGCDRQLHFPHPKNN